MMTYAEFKRLDVYKTANVVEIFGEFEHFDIMIEQNNN